MVSTDLDNSLAYSVVWDISSARSDLPKGIAHEYEPTNVPGAKPTTGYDRRTRGNLGPCPGTEHSYRFELHAIDVAALPAVGLR